MPGGLQNAELREKLVYIQVLRTQQQESSRDVNQHLVSTSQAAVAGAAARFRALIPSRMGPHRFGGLRLTRGGGWRGHQGLIARGAPNEPDAKRFQLTSKFHHGATRCEPFPDGLFSSLSSTPRTLCGGSSEDSAGPSPGDVARVLELLVRLHCLSVRVRRMLYWPRSGL
jgi:hypothetical protein